MEQIPQDFIDTIRLLTNNDTNVIKAAEENFNRYKAQPDQLIGCLLFLMVHSTDQLLKDFSAVLVRPLISPNDKNTLWDKINQNTKENIKTQLLELIKSDLSKSSRHKIVSIISSVAPALLNKNEWNIMPFLIEAAKSPSEPLRESAFLIVGNIAPEIAQIIKPHVLAFVEIIKAGLNDQSVMVQIAALSAVSNFINIQEIDTTPFKSLLPLMISATTRAIEMNQEKSAQDAIVVFIIIAETRSNWFAANIVAVFESFYEILVSEMVEEETRHYVLEFFMTLAQKRPSTFKKRPDFLNRVINVLYKWAATVDEIPLEKWNQSSDDGGDDDNTDADTAQSSFDRLATDLPKQLVELSFNKYIPTLLKSSLWGERYAALMSIAMLCEGSRVQLESKLSGVLELILPLVQDPVPRVRWCLFFCLGQMASDFGDNLKPHYENLFRAVGMCANDPNPRVQGVLCLFLSTFLEDFKKDLILPHVEVLFQLLAPMMSSKFVYVAEHALSAFSSIVECIEEDFTKYYDKFMPFLLDILKNKTSKQFRDLRGRAIEAISLIGLAVKKERFAKDLGEIMNFISTQPQFESDDPQIDFFLRAFTRFCQCLEKDFRPYLEFCMKPILQAIKASVEIVTTNYGDDYVEDSVAESSSMAVENKSLALSLLAIYTTVLKEDMFPYLEPLVTETVKLINYEYNESIRTNSVTLIPHLYKVAHYHSNSQPSEFNQKLFVLIVKKLLESANAELLPEIISEKLKALSEVIEVAGALYLNQEEITEIFANMTKIFEILDELRDDADAELDDEDDDPQGNVELQFIEDAYNNVAIAIGDVLLSAKEKSVQSLQQNILANILERITSEKSSDTVRSSMICIIDDLIENGGQSAVQLYSHILPPLVRLCAESKDAAVKHASAFGIGIAAQMGPQQFTPYIFESLKNLNTCIVPKGSHKVEADDLAASDNAVSAVGRIISNCYATLGGHLNEIVPLWISHLPIKDEAESPFVVENLIKVIKANPSCVSQNSYDNIIQVFVDGSLKSYIKAEILPEVKGIMISLKSYIEPRYASLSEDQKKAIAALLQ